MENNLKKIIKKVTPPFLIDIAKTVRGGRKYGFFGKYASWKEAVSDSKGYDDGAILAKVKDSLLKVKSGEAAYERDSVLFDKIQYSWPLLSALLLIASRNNSELNVIDFGGSLGSTYFQNLQFLKKLKKVRWNVVEQDHYAVCGKKYFEDDNLKFYNNLHDCLRETKPDAILISGTIQYIENPYSLLKEIIAMNLPFVIFDRTTFLSGEDRLTVQKVPPRIYSASYPAWFLNDKKFLETMTEKYALVADFDSLAGKINLGDKIAFEKGFIFQLK